MPTFHGMRGLLLLAALLATLGLAVAQDLTPRRGLSIKIVEPESGGIVSGATRIRAEVTARRAEEIVKVEFFVDDRLVFADSEPPWQVVHDVGKKPGVHVFRVVAHHKDGPTVSDFVISKALDPQYVVNVQRVVLDVSVRDGNKRLVRGLRKDDFAVSENGRPQELLDVVVEQRPLLIGILIDTSGSMRGERLERAQQAACEFVKTLRPDDRAFVIDFDERVFLIQEPTADAEALCRATASTEPIGGTSIFDAIHAAYRVIHETEAERRALVVLSDGDDTHSNVAFDEILLEAQLAEVTVYGVGLDVGALSDGRRQMRELADTTGGRAFFVTRAEELAGSYGAITDELRSLYQLVYSSDNETFDGTFINVSVTVRDGAGYDIKHRSGYYAIEHDGI